MGYGIQLGNKKLNKFLTNRNTIYEAKKLSCQIKLQLNINCPSIAASFPHLLIGSLVRTKAATNYPKPTWAHLKRIIEILF